MEEIKGVRSDAEKSRWWYFEVNGYRSNVAAERYLVKHGDTIRWLYLETPKRSSTTPSPVAKGADKLDVGLVSESGSGAAMCRLAEERS